MIEIRHSVLRHYLSILAIFCFCLVGGCWLNDRKNPVAVSSQAWIDETQTASIVQEIKFKILLPTKSQILSANILSTITDQASNTASVIFKLILVNPT
ncbi:MAG: hypothetical protein PHD82_15700, partial [Candidatus Riflebacteria bacterium]|nr:hypothetical protein [Candidatus Riflebacteria bacterium]